MIENKIKILSEYLSKQNNMTWVEKRAFNDIVEHCASLDGHYKEKTLYLERLASWYVDHMFELHQDHINEVSYEFVKHILIDRLCFILNTSSEYNYRSIENNMMALDIANNNQLKPYGSISEAIRLFVKDAIVYNTKDEYERT